MNVIRVPGEAVAGGVGPARAAGAATREAQGPSFQEELRRSEIRFTRHAEERLQKRSISLGQEHMARLEEALRTAESKGAVNSLVLMDGLALVVNVTTRNVVTACDQGALRDGVFTNIDSAVIIRDA